MRYRVALSQSPQLNAGHNMPTEKSTNQKNNKPLTPALSSTFRANRPQLTPKIAGATSSTPLRPSQNGTRSDVSSPPGIPSTNTGNANASPALDTNITPRSGARRTKLGGSPVVAGGSQASTPASSRPVSTIEGLSDSPVTGSSAGSAGLGINTARQGANFHPRPISLAGSQHNDKSTRRTSISSNSQLGETAPSKFFHADDAQSAASVTSLEEKPQLRNKAATFFYAGTAPGGVRKPSPPRSTPSPVMRREAHTIPTAVAHKTESRTNAVSVTRGLNRRSPSPRLQSPPMVAQQKPGPRPPSPLKSVSFESVSTSTDALNPRENKLKATPSVPQARNAAIVSSATPRRKVSLVSNISSTPIAQQKSPSISSGTFSRTRTPSLSSSSSPLSAQPPKTVTPLPLSSSPELSPKSVSFSPTTRKRLSISGPFMSPEIAPVSPTRADSRPQSQSQLQKMNELAANARRERKVLDLEISNSSLLAINRTLERELRKQGTELRRFRRLSRAGRLSVPEGPGVRLVSRHSSLHDETRDSYSGDDMSHLDSIYESSDDDADSLDSSLRSDSPSNSPPHSSSQRARDEKRLLLDLSKHRQLLVDSQKMSQSIKRCLTWTDQLISEGTKALEYKVHVSDVELGGRVLVREEDAEEQGADRGSTALLSPAAEVGQAEESKFWELREEVTERDLEQERDELDKIPPLDAELDGLPR